MRLVSDFDKLAILIRNCLADKPFSEEEKIGLSNFVASESYKSLPETVEEAEDNKKIGLYLLRKAADTLLTLAQNNYHPSENHIETLSTVIAGAKDVTELTLVADPFEGRYYQLLAKLAEQIDVSSAESFRFRFESYQKLYQLEKAVLGSVADLNPEVSETLQELFEPTIKSIPEIAPVDLTNNKLDEMFEVIPTMFMPRSLAETPYLPAARDEISHEVTFKVFDDVQRARSHKFIAKILGAQDLDTSFELHFSLTPSEAAYEYLQTITDKVWSVRLIVENNQAYTFTTDDVIEKVCMGEEISLVLAKPKQWLTLEGIDPYDVWEKLSTIVVNPK